MRRLACALLPLIGCGGVIRHQAAGTTAEILARAQPSLQQESDYELAARALPGALKTIEGFYVADAQPALREILTEGYCQYATAFVEDEWETAKLNGKLDDAAYHNERASKMFTRCMNYALMDLPGGFDKDLFDKTEIALKRVGNTGSGYRTALMFAGLGLGGVVLHNLTRSDTDVLAYQDVVEAIMKRVIAFDAARYGQIDGTKKVPCDASCTVHIALPHVALGMLYTAKPKALGGRFDEAKAEFETALRITADAKHPDGRLLLARVLLAYRVGAQGGDRKLFHDELTKVLATDPAIWPEQRLANEVAHRRARRYLSHEKELFQ